MGAFLVLPIMDGIGVKYELLYDFYFGNQIKDIAPYAKYRIGYLIVESFLEENPNLSIKEWTELPAEYIFMNSKYK